MKNVRPKPPNITLDKLLRRRGLTFDAWMHSASISSYPEVQRWCAKVGVIPPSEPEYKALRPEPVNAPADGIVVIEPTDVVLTIDSQSASQGKKKRPKTLSPDA